jgi:hypothetical protein
MKCKYNCRDKIIIGRFAILYLPINVLQAIKSEINRWAGHGETSNSYTIFVVDYLGSEQLVTPKSGSLG